MYTHTQESFKINAAKTDVTKRRNRQIYNYSWRPQGSSLSNRWPDRPRRPKISKAIEDLNNTIKQSDQKHNTTPEYILFSCKCGTFPKTDYMLGHKTHLNIFKTSKIIYVL